MSKQAPQVEWYIAQDEAAWAAHTRLPNPASTSGGVPTSPAPRAAQRWLGGVALLLLLLVSAGDRWWRTAQAGPHAAAAVVTAPAPKELEPAAQGADLRAARLAGDPVPMDAWRQWAREDRHWPAVHNKETWAQFVVQGDQAVVRVLTTDQQGTAVYRQTHFYRHTEAGWQQAAPAAALWGPARSLETPSFVFRFRQNDAPAVIAVAPQLGLVGANAQKITVLPCTVGVRNQILSFISYL